MDLTEKVTASEYKFNGRIINLRVDSVELPDGSCSTREIVEHNGGVGVLAITDSGDILTVKQYRSPYAQVVCEIPAGKLERGEDPLECGKRELKEETGATAQKWLSLGKLYPSPGYCGEVIHLFLATELSFGDCRPDEDEFLEAECIEFDKAVEAVLNGQIRDAKTQVAILKAKLLKERNEL